MSEDQLDQRLKVVRQGLADEERVLTLQNYVDFLAPSDADRAVYLPFHTLSASELQGLSQVQERLLRKYGCTIIRKAGAMLHLP